MTIASFFTDTLDAFINWNSLYTIVPDRLIRLDKGLWLIQVLLAGLLALTELAFLATVAALAREEVFVGFLMSGPHLSEDLETVPENDDQIVDDDCADNED